MIYHMQHIIVFGLTGILILPLFGGAGDLLDYTNALSFIPKVAGGLNAPDDFEGFNRSLGLQLRECIIKLSGLKVRPQIQQGVSALVL